MKYFRRLCFLILMGTACSCFKDPIHIDLFPIKPNPGKFECYINGADFVPDQGGFHTYGPVTTYLTQAEDGTYDIIIEASQTVTGNEGGQGVSLSAQNISGTGTYEFNALRYQEADYYSYRPISSNGSVSTPVYRAATPGHGNLKLTRFDLKNKVIAGTFSFNAVNTRNAADSVKITAGHFNISDYISR